MKCNNPIVVTTKDMGGITYASGKEIDIVAEVISVVHSTILKKRFSQQQKEMWHNKGEKVSGWMEKKKIKLCPFCNQIVNFEELKYGTERDVSRVQ